MGEVIMGDKNKVFTSSEENIKCTVLRPLADKFQELARQIDSHKYELPKTISEAEIITENYIDQGWKRILAWHSAELDKAVIKELQNMENTYRKLWRDDFADQVMFYREKRIKELPQPTNQVSEKE